LFDKSLHKMTTYVRSYFIYSRNL